MNSLKKTFSITKIKLSKFRLDRHMKRSIKTYTKALTTYLNIINKISVPKSDAEKELLKKVIESYYETIYTLEDSYMKYAKSYIDDDDDLDELFKVITEIDGRYTGCNCVRPEYLSLSWDELCNKGIKLLEDLKDGK